MARHGDLPRLRGAAAFQKLAGADADRKAEHAHAQYERRLKCEETATPTPPARNRMKPPRPWATSWRRCGKDSQKQTAQRTGWEAELPCRCAAFFRPCGSACRSLTYRPLKTRTFYIAKRPENHGFRGVLCDSDTIWIFHC